MVEDFGFTVGYVLTLVARLQKKELVERVQNRISVTNKAEKYLSDLAKPIRTLSVVPTQLRVVGSVKAGTASPDELEVDTNFSSLETISIPSTKLEKDMYALKVVGESMEHEGIYDGDYVFVEAFSGVDSPRDGEMIVAKYYPLDLENDDFDVSVPETDYFGPTLKIFSRGEKNENNKQEVFHLSWKKEKELNKYAIIASRLKPLGRVVGVYREINNNSQSTPSPFRAVKVWI